MRLFQNINLLESATIIFIIKTLAGLFIFIGIIYRQAALNFGIFLSLGVVPFHYWIIKRFREITPQLIVLFSWVLKIIPLRLVSLTFYGILITGVSSVLGRTWIWKAKNLSSIVVSSGIRQLGFIYNSIIVFRPIIFLRLYYLFVFLLVNIPIWFNWWIVSAIPPRPLFFLKISVLFRVSGLVLILLLVSIVVSIYPYVKWISKF